MERNPNFYGASYLILKKGEEILLQKRTNTGWQDGNWGLPAGHIEGKESVKDALKREIAEEIGVKLEDSDTVLKHVMHRVSGDDRVYFDFFFVSEKWTGEPINLETEKHGEVKWFPIDSIPENTIPYLKRTIERIDKNIFFSEDVS